MATALDMLIRAALRAAVRPQSPPAALRPRLLRVAGARTPEAGWWETRPLWDAWGIPIFRAPLVV